MDTIYLVGFMGTGKTSVGRQLAKAKQYQFIDLDSLIEAREQKQISSIFADQGEPYFRKVEKEILQEVSQGHRQVVACGGGIVIDKDNIAVMKATGKLVCLTASADVIFNRTFGRTHRPLLNVENPKERIEELLKARAPFYALADHIIDTSQGPVQEIVDQIVKLIAATGIN